MFRLFFILSFLSLTISCQDKFNDSRTPEYLIFGEFYGMCNGETCVEIFKIDHNNLYEDENDNYPNSLNISDTKFNLLDKEKYELVRELINDFPSALLAESEHTLGCPDCHDQGGFYIEYKNQNDHQFWIIDQNLGAVDKNLHAFLHQVSESIALIKQ
ncbi:MAG: hypothetical protein ACPGLV_12590 [Bacteroidia bacterium]